MEKRAFITVIIILALLFSAVATTFVESTQANPIINVYRDIPPPEGTQAPIITIHTPRNSSSYPKNITLTFDVTIPKTNGEKSIAVLTKIYYKGSWETNEITVAEGCFGSFSIDLSEAPGGNLSVTIYAVGVGYIETGEEYREENGVIWSYNYYDRFEIIGYSTVSFIKDLVPPRITLLSPQNRTYVTSDVELDFTVNEAVAQILYCLDGKENHTITGNMTLTGLSEGEHSVTLYADDVAGNAAASKTLFFSVDLSESFPIVLVATSVTVIAFISAGLLMYFKKHKR